MRVDFAAVLAVASLALFVVSAAFSMFNVAPFGVPFGAFFAAGCVLLVLAIVFRPRRRRP